jgi:hypothetical protein
MQTPGEFAENLVTQPCNKNNAAPADICKIDRFKTLPYERRSREKIQKYLIDSEIKLRSFFHVFGYPWVTYWFYEIGDKVTFGSEPL